MNYVKGFFKNFAKKEAFKMRDVAPGPWIVVPYVIPALLIVIVVAVAIFAVTKVVKISQKRKEEGRDHDDI